MIHKIMTSETHLHPWKNGYWYNSSQKCLLTKIGDDGIFETHTTNYLDYPNMVPKFIGTWTYGKYKEAISTIFDATGIKNYNLEIDSRG